MPDDAYVWAALKQGGKVILLRHAHVDIREGIGQLAPGSCAVEVNLSPRGVKQAKRIGEAFRAHGIAVGEVLTSPYCRCIDTGRLAFGRATPAQYLMPPGVVSDNQARLNRHRFLGIGQMSADGFFMSPDGSVRKFTEEDVWAVT